jgi:hypothetical protein
MSGPWDFEALRAAWERAIPMQRGIYRPQKKRRRARSGETIAALEDMYAATGDASFRAAVESMKKYGLDHQDAGTWRVRETRVETTCIARMHHLRKRDGTLSVRRAAAMAAVMFWVEGASFEAVVRRLERAYGRAKLDP